MLMNITCPACQKEGTISLLEPDYNGPYRCWKCRGLFTMNIHNNKVLACEPLSEEDYEKQKAADELRKKVKR
jgi:hypothetical protein